MTASRTTAALLTGLLLLGCTAACSGTGADNPAPSGSGSMEVVLPHKGAPVPGLVASELISAAHAALPGGLEGDYRWVGMGYVPWTETEVGYPEPGEHDMSRIGAHTPSVTIWWEDDGTVLLVGCGDMVSAGLSPVMAVCTDLSIPGVPAGALTSLFNGYPDEPWQSQQPFPQITLFGFDYPPHPPNTGTARVFSILGPDPPAVELTNTSSL
jgi:hypothetical protein